jgi:hypothetical protein
MKRILFIILALTFVAWSSVIFAQMQGLHGNDAATRMGVHSGNQLRTTFYNDGTFGNISPTTPDEIRGEWPINSGHIYIVDGNIFVGSEVPDKTNGQLFHILSENKSANIGGSKGDTDPVSGAWWTFLPLDGFGDPASTRIAMAKGSSEWPNSWPAFWPDKNNEVGDPGWRNDAIDNNPNKAAWNGYFGKNVFNADEESYFVADDYMNREFMSKFLPDSNDPERGGLGLRLYVRGFQWAKASVADALFCVFDIQNIGTYNHDKMVFAYKLGNNNGDTETGGDSGDDGASFIRDTMGVTYNLTWTWDGNDIGAGGWSPVGRAGVAFLESPGNPYDGIDNDNDARVGPNGERANVPGIGTGDDITVSMFDRGILDMGTQVVLINYADPTFPRIPSQGGMTYAAALDLARQGNYSAFRTIGDTLEVLYGVRSNKFWPGKPLVEMGKVNGVDLGENLIDDNLNGLIDESRGQPDRYKVIQYLYIGYKCKNYFTGNGFQNRMLDERRDDVIDNDGDWNPEKDDVGADGLAPGVRGYPGPDIGEKDGIPTSGEPHFDKTDVDESDQLGLTNCNNYDWGGATNQQYNDEGYWNLMIPGIFVGATVAGNYELLMASGYFPLAAGTTERISIANVMANTDAGLLGETQNVDLAYGNNYNFAQAPAVPTLTAVPGDNKVYLFWDDLAELTADPVTGKDFEGYRIYRSTDPGFNDGGYITDARYGNKLWSIPIAQFDVVDDIYGINYSIPTLGVQFNLGSDNGVRHFFVDTTAVNGYTYFYAVTSYDKGSIPVDPATGKRSITRSDTLKIDPSECAKFVAVQSSGAIEKGKNVAVIRPEAKAGGYMDAKLTDAGIVSQPTNTAEGSIKYSILVDDNVKQNHTYQVTFKDSINANKLLTTLSYSVKDLTDNVIIVKDKPLPGAKDEQNELVSNAGIKLNFVNNPAALSVDSVSSGYTRGDIFYGWLGLGIPYLRLVPYPAYGTIQYTTSDLEMIFSDLGIDSSKGFWRKPSASGKAVYLPPLKTDFTIINKKTGERIPFALRTYTGKASEVGNENLGKFTFKFKGRKVDEIIILAPHPTIPDSLLPGWQISYLLSATQGADTLHNVMGDRVLFSFSNPFLSNDVFEFTTVSGYLDANKAKEEMDKIRVVPNPYIVTNTWEPRNPYSDGRGDREIHFTHLPPRCTIRIFNIKGQLINTLEHEATGTGSNEQLPQYNGTLSWNMLSKDNLEISYGIYIYHIDAPGIGEKIGKFLVIK